MSHTLILEHWNPIVLKKSLTLMMNKNKKTDKTQRINNFEIDWFKLSYLLLLLLLVVICFFFVEAFWKDNERGELDLELTDFIILVVASLPCWRTIEDSSSLLLSVMGRGGVVIGICGTLIDSSFFDVLNRAPLSGNNERISSCNSLIPFIFFAETTINSSHV